MSTLPRRNRETDVENKFMESKGGCRRVGEGGRLGLTYIFMASLVAQIVKNLPAMQETQVESLGGENPLEKRIGTYSKPLSGELHG